MVINKYHFMKQSHDKMKMVGYEIQYAIFQLLAIQERYCHAHGYTNYSAVATDVQ